MTVILFEILLAQREADLFLLLFLTKKKEAHMDLPFVARLDTFLKFCKKLHIVIQWNISRSKF